MPVMRYEIKKINALWLIFDLHAGVCKPWVVGRFKTKTQAEKYLNNNSLFLFSGTA